MHEYMATDENNMRMALLIIPVFGAGKNNAISGIR
jgi:hypothetical protein